MMKSQTVAAAFCVAAIAVPALAQAQAPAQEESDGTIIVTAQKRAERLQDVPLSVIAQSAIQQSLFDCTAMLEVKINR